MACRGRVDEGGWASSVSARPVLKAEAVEVNVLHELVFNRDASSTTLSGTRWAGDQARPPRWLRETTRCNLIMRPFSRTKMVLRVLSSVNANQTRRRKSMVRVVQERQQIVSRPSAA